MRPTRPSPLRHLARRYALPAVVALVVHGAMLLWPDHRSPSPGSRRGGAHASRAPLEVALAEQPSPETPAAANLPEPGATEPSSTTDQMEERLEFTPPSAPRPDAFTFEAVPLHATTPDVDTLAAALRDPVPGLGLRHGEPGALASLGAPRPTQSAHRGDADGPLDLYELAQLDCEPALLRVPEFQFPTHLSRQGLHAGRVTVVVRVNASGRVSLLSVTDSSHPDLVPAVRDAVARALFQPPLRQGRRVALRYSWTLELKDRTQIADRGRS